MPAKRIEIFVSEGNGARDGSERRALLSVLGRVKCDTSLDFRGP